MVEPKDDNTGAPSAAEGGADYRLAFDPCAATRAAIREREQKLSASPAPALPESGVEAMWKALERADLVFHFDLRHMIEWGDGYNQAVKDAADGVRSALRAALATPAPAPAPAPAPVDAAGLVSKALGFAQDGKFMSDEAAKAVADLAAAFTAAAEREAALVRERDIANDAREAHAACATALIDKIEKEMDEISATLPGVRFMDPPDGGSPTLAEQVGRMRAALDAAEARITAAEAERDAERERCALVAETYHPASIIAREIAAAIRKETT